MTKPSILLIGNLLSSQGGNRTMAEEFSHFLEEAGYSLIAASAVHYRPIRLLDMLWTSFVRRSDYQIAYVEVYSGRAFVWAEMVCGLLGILRKPYILTLHGGNLPAFAGAWPERVKRLLQGAGAVTAPSRYLQESMRPYRDDILLIPNPLSIQNYSFCLRSPIRPKLVWLRAFHYIYRPQLAVGVIAGLCASFPAIHLKMIGPDKGDGSLSEVQQMVDCIGLGSHIGIVPGIPKLQVPLALGQADIFINTTSVDNTPVSIMEAMACGMCIVSTDVGGIPYLLEDGKDALLVPPDDSQTMINAVKRLFAEPGLAERLSCNARHKAERFDWSVILPQWEALFADVIANHPRSS